MHTHARWTTKSYILLIPRASGTTNKQLWVLESLQLAFTNFGNFKLSGIVLIHLMEKSTPLPAPSSHPLFTSCVELNGKTE